MITGWRGSYGGMYPFSGLLMLLTWLAVAALVLWAVSALVAPGPTSGHNTAPGPVSEQDAALALLTRRYNAGAITALEYEQARKAIGR